MTKSNTNRIATMQSEYMEQYEAQMQREQRRRRRLLRRLAVFGIITVIVFGSMTMYHFKQRKLYAEKQDQYEQLHNELILLELEEKRLQEEIDLLSDDEYILDIARTNYFLSKEGELIFQLEDDERSY